MEARIAAAVAEAERAGIGQKAVTPYLLARVRELTGGQSLAANVALIRNNAALAASSVRARARLPAGASADVRPCSSSAMS